VLLGILDPLSSDQADLFAAGTTYSAVRIYRVVACAFSPFVGYAFSAYASASAIVTSGSSSRLWYLVDNQTFWTAMEFRASAIWSDRAQAA
jgi:hypothetical protein